MILPKIVYRQGFMLHFLSNGNSNETGVFSPFLQKCQRSSIYGAFRTFYILQVLDIADFWEKYFPLSSYIFSYLSKSFNRSKSVCAKSTRGFESLPLRQKVQFHPFGWIEPLFFVLCSACKSHTDYLRTVKFTVGIKVAVNI